MTNDVCESKRITQCLCAVCVCVCEGTDCAHTHTLDAKCVYLGKCDFDSNEVWRALVAGFRFDSEKCILVTRAVKIQLQAM
jgi:hypothetical protein